MTSSVCLTTTTISLKLTFKESIIFKRLMQALEKESLKLFRIMMTSGKISKSKFQNKEPEFKI